MSFTGLSYFLLFFLSFFPLNFFMFLLFVLLTTMIIHEFAVPYLEEDLLQGDLDLDWEYGEREQDLR